MDSYNSDPLFTLISVLNSGPDPENALTLISVGQTERVSGLIRIGINRTVTICLSILVLFVQRVAIYKWTTLLGLTGQGSNTAFQVSSLPNQYDQLKIFQNLYNANISGLDLVILLESIYIYMYL